MQQRRFFQEAVAFLDRQTDAELWQHAIAYSEAVRAGTVEELTGIGPELARYAYNILPKQQKAKGDGLGGQLMQSMRQQRSFMERVLEREAELQGAQSLPFIRGGL